MTIRNWNGGHGSIAAAFAWTPPGTPVSGDVLLVSDGTVDASNRTLSGLTIGMPDSSLASGMGFAVGSPTLVMRGTTVAADTTIRVGGGRTNESAPPYVATIEAYSTNWNRGTIAAKPTQGYGHQVIGGHLTIEVGTRSAGAARFNNSGTLSAERLSTTAVDGVSRGAELNNTGTISATYFVKLDIDVVGSGRMIFEKPSNYYMGPPSSSKIEVDRSVGAGQTVDFADATDTDSHGTLVIGDIRDFHASIKDFALSASAYGLGTDEFLLRGTFASSVKYVGNTAAGDLKVFAGSKQIGSLHLIGDYTTAKFAVGSSGTDTSIFLTA